MDCTGKGDFQLTIGVLIIDDEQVCDDRGNWRHIEIKILTTTYDRKSTKALEMA